MFDSFHSELILVDVDDILRQEKITRGINNPRVLPGQQGWTEGKHQAGTSP